MGSSGSKRPKVAIFASDTCAGGAERVAAHLAGGFASDGWQVDFVALRASDETLLPDSVQLLDLRAKRARYAIPMLRAYVKRARPDVLIAINFEQNLAAAVALLGVRRAPVLLLTIHAPVAWYLSHCSGVSRWLSLQVSRWLYRTADRVIAVSRGLAREIDALRLSRKPVEIIGNPVLPENLDRLAEEPVSHPWLKDKEVPVVLAVGRLSAVKNYPLLLEAFAKIRQKLNARLMITGSGECRDDLDARIAASAHADSICLAGHVGNVFPIMRAADVLVLSSDAEGFGNVLVEAMAVGTPVVSTDCPHGPREILEDGKSGTLVPPGDADALAKAIVDQLSAPRGRAVSRALEFTIAAKTREYSSLARTVIEERRSQS